MLYGIWEPGGGICALGVSTRDACDVRPACTVQVHEIPKAKPVRRGGMIILHRVGVGFRGVGYFYRFTPISPGSQLLPYGGSSGQLLPSYHLIKFCLGALRAPFTATHAHTTVTAPSAHRPPHTCQSCVQFGSGGDGGSMPATSSGLAPDARATLARPRVDAVKLGMY